MAETKKLFDHVVRLRRAERLPEAAADVAPVRADLEARIGATLSRGRAAHILGVSQTALDRWVRAGEIPTVLTPNGRVEVPLRFVVEMVDSIHEQECNPRRHPLAAALRQRRRSGDEICASIATWDRNGPTAGHGRADERSLAYHRIVADRLDERLNADASRRTDLLEREGHMDRHYADRWRALLALPPAEVARVITGDDQNARDLRQNTPFAGVLNEHERRAIVATVGP